MSKHLAVEIIAGTTVCALAIALVYLNARDTSFPATEFMEAARESETSIVQKVGEEREIRSWENGGTTAVLYEQDLIVDREHYSGPASEQVLKAKRPGAAEVLLDRYESAGSFSKAVEEVYISPRGTYVTAEVAGYESRYTTTYAAQTGRKVLEPGSKKVPYWTSDEKKVALIQSAASIDGTPAAFYYSGTGDLENATLVKEFDVLNFYIESTIQQGDLLTVTVSDATYGGVAKQTYILDLQTGTMTN